MRTKRGVPTRLARSGLLLQPQLLLSVQKVLRRERIGDAIRSGGRHDRTGQINFEPAAIRDTVFLFLFPTHSDLLGSNANEFPLFRGWMLVFVFLKEILFQCSYQSTTFDLLA